MENKPIMESKPVKERSPLIRALALLAAIAVLIGSIWFFVSPILAQSGKGAAVPVLSAAHAEGEWKTLQKGSSGAEVRKAQQALKALEYYTGKVDGNFSKAFEEAVIAFQKDFGLTPNGQLDEETYLLITEDVRDDSPTQAPKAKATAAPKATAKPKATATPAPTPAEDLITVVFGQDYSDKDHVAYYLHTYGELPPNYITKNQAQDLGWVSSWGNLWQVAPGKSIGGDRFGNYEGQLPAARGRKYFECDIDFDGKYRNAKRIIFSSDGLIFYTEDHYTTFEEMD